MPLDIHIATASSAVCQDNLRLSLSEEEHEALGRAARQVDKPLIVWPWLSDYARDATVTTDSLGPLLSELDQMSQCAEDVRHITERLSATAIEAKQQGASLFFVAD